MKLKATTEANQRRALRDAATNQQANVDDVIRMKFLQQSAKYLGVYYDDKPIHWLDDKNTIS